MESEKILRVLLGNPDIDAATLSELSGVKKNTVETVLQRHRKSISSRPSESSTRGRPPLLYSIRPEWKDALRQRWAIDHVAGGSAKNTQLERALEIVDSASLAANDDMQSIGDREQMAETARERIDIANVLVAKLGDDDAAIIADASRRIRRAELLLEKAFPTVHIQEEPERILRRDWLPQWAERVQELARKYGSEIVEAAKGNDGFAVVLDLIPGDRDSLQVGLMERFHEIGKRAVFVPMTELASSRQEEFLDDFAGLALDPIARFAELYVTMDSRRQESRNTWHRIDSLVSKDRVPSIVSLAMDSIRKANTQPEVSTPVVDYYAGFVKGVVSKQTDPGRSLWEDYGTPNVFDLGNAPTFQRTVEEKKWQYHGGPDIPKFEGRVSTAF